MIMRPAMEVFWDSHELDWLVERLVPEPPPDAERQRELEDIHRYLDDLVQEQGGVIGEATPIVSYCGLDAEGWESSAWILHAIYETGSLPGGITYDDVDQIERATGTGTHSLEGKSDRDRRIDEAVSELTAEGTTLSVHYDGWLGPGWTRLPWIELWRRLAVDPALLEGYPCFAWFPYRSWPVSIAPPREGSLDREQFERMLIHLEEASPRGGATPCIASYGACAIGEFDHDVLYRGSLRDIRSLFDREELSGSPSNFWPEDRSWLVYTDWDLWATKVSGTGTLIERLESDPELEIAQLPFPSATV